jgi:GT2 family glycosyltransferase
MTDGRVPRIVALVLTHNAPRALDRCLAAIEAQTTQPDEIVVVDNASDPPVEVDRVSLPGLPLRVVRSDVNLGPAGGWAIALRDFLKHGGTHAWLMDDDIVPEDKCLAALWDAASDRPESAFAVPVSIQPDGKVGRWGSWCGFLIARQIVEIVGLPREELFWWAEDTEYCHWRIPQAGFRLRFIEGAVVHHDAIRQGGDLPTWKYYYESRNMLYLHWHIMHRTGRYPKNFSRLVGRALFRQQQDRIACLVAIGRGLIDGATGRLGIRYPTVAMHERDLQ